MAADPPGAYDAVLLVSFGGPEGPDDVLPFLENVTRGRGVPPERLAQVAEQYLQRGGRSPINDHNRALLAALRDELAARGIDLPVYWGNRNWHPLLPDTVREMAGDGVTRALALVTSAFSSYSSCRQYLEDLARARAEVGDGAPQIDKVRPFFNHPAFVDAQAERVAAALGSLRQQVGYERAARAPLAFSAHSIPLAQAATCAYEAELAEAARLVVERLAPPPPGAEAGERPWTLSYQSRSGPPQVPWLGPDIGDRVEELAAAGADAAVVVPIGFVSDHMEVVHDLDTVALGRARRAGLTAVRAGTVGTHPRFVAGLVDLLVERLTGAPPVAIGRLPARPDVCPPDCCPAPRRAVGAPSPRGSSTRGQGARFGQT